MSDAMAVAIQIRVPRIDYTDKHLCHIDAPLLRCFDQLEHKCFNDRNEDAAEEEDKGSHHVGIREEPYGKVSKKKEDKQHQGEALPERVPFLPGG